MGKAKEIRIAPITSSDANRLCKMWHYSGKVVPNSQIHFGVFYKGSCQGVMQFGPSMDKRKVMTLVSGTKMNDFLELNRMAFSDGLPRNSESRAISIAIGIIKKNYPNIQWIVSYADATQCGDGTIYRASGFYLTGIKENKTILRLPSGEIVADKTLNNTNYKLDGMSAGKMKKLGAKPLSGFQMRYIYFIDKSAKSKLVPKILDFSEIKRLNASMYKGARVEHESNAVSFHETEGGAVPTDTLQRSIDAGR